MAGSNNFLQFDSTLNNAYSDASYADLSAITKGIQIGIADPMMHNKLFYQLSTFVTAYAQVFANLGYTVSDSSLTDLITVLSNTLTTDSLWQSFTGDFHSQTTKGFYVTATVGQTNAPASLNKYYLIVATTGTLIYHLAIDATNGYIWWEIYNGVTWSSWTEFLTGASGSVTATMLATGAAVSNIGYTPANKSGDTFTGAVTATSFNGPLTGNVTGNVVGTATTAAGIPIGGIILWSGTVANISAISSTYGTFNICDGTNGTPNLEDKFVLGAGSTYAVGATGGEATHVLTTSEMPSHTHSVTAMSYSSGSLYNGTQTQAYNSSSLTTSSTGGDVAHNNMPPYYALCYIMRIS